MSNVYVNPPQKYSAIIKAWADGAQIQFRFSNGKWIDVSCPSWSDDIEYRIKSQPPEEPYYGEIARAALHKVKHGNIWNATAQAVIDAYKKHQEALKEFNQES